jgi:hypothetical protein
MTIKQAVHVTDRALVGWRILLILLFFNMLVCAYSGRVGWMLFWAIAFSSYVHEHGYEYGKIQGKRGSNRNGVTSNIRHFTRGLSPAGCDRKE